jgi:hypothetical protein
MDLKEFGTTRSEKIVALILAFHSLDLGTLLAKDVQERDGMLLVHFIFSVCDFLIWLEQLVSSWLVSKSSSRKTKPAP